MTNYTNLLNGLENSHQHFTPARQKLQTESESADVSRMIETVSGRLVNVSDPDPNTIVIEDIAWALSRLPRFAGHSITETAYNVAQHSVYVAELLAELLANPEEFQLSDELVEAVSYYNRLEIAPRNAILLKALLHDAHEAYTGDIPSPVKRIPELHSTFKVIEARLDEAIRTKFTLVEPTEHEKMFIKHCDKLAQSIEGYQFMPSRGLTWDLPRPDIKRLQRFPDPLPALQSYDGFLKHFDKLTGAV